MIRVFSHPSSGIMYFSYSSSFYLHPISFASQLESGFFCREKKCSCWSIIISFMGVFRFRLYLGCIWIVKKTLQISKNIVAPVGHCIIFMLNALQFYPCGIFSIRFVYFFSIQFDRRIQFLLWFHLRIGMLIRAPPVKAEAVGLSSVSPELG